MSPPVAVIDIGSNSIKILIAARGSDGSVVSLRSHTIDARISAGISRARPELADEAMYRGLAAIRALLEIAQELSPAKIQLVATSAVRDAANGPEFRARVEAGTGHAIRILTGDEEANLIGRGLTTDPALLGLRDFYVFDLGGGSLECLAFRHRTIERAVSLQLGCVRLTEKFIRDPSQPMSPDERAALARHVRTSIGAAFSFSLPAGSVAVGTGGTLASARAILGAREGKEMEATPSLLTVSQLEELLDSVGTLPLIERKQVPGLPPPRADVFPTALATFIALAELGGFSGFQNSLHNLRFGLAEELLGVV